MKPVWAKQVRNLCNGSFVDKFTNVMEENGLTKGYGNRFTFGLWIRTFEGSTIIRC